MRLFIAEKPDLAKAIVAGLGGQFTKKDGYYINNSGNDVVTWCYGHMLQLLDPEDYDEKYKHWNLDDLPFVFLPPKRKVNKKTSKQTKVIKDLLKQSTTVVNAGDPDDEGQLLVDELLRHFNVKKPVLRLLINDNNTKVVTKAIANMRPNAEFEHLGYKAEARSIADQILGYNLTRAYTIKGQQEGGQGVISIGRVQTPILGLIVRRDREHQSHKKSFYYNVTANFGFDNVAFSATYKPTESDPITESGKLAKKDVAEAIAAACLGKVANIIEIETVKKEQPPPLPYNLLKLQQDASRKFGYRPDKTLEITQNLREKSQLITYNRSDCQYLNEEQHSDAEEILNAIASNSNLLVKAATTADSKIKGRVFNNAKVSAHHAIIPTSSTANLDGLSEPEKNIYLLIARSYIAQFHENYVFDETKTIIEVEGYQFAVTAKVDLSLGWETLYKNDQGNEETEDQSGVEAADLRNLTLSSKGRCNKAVATEHETKPAPLYTINSLLGDLTRVAKYVKNPKLAEILKQRDKDKAGEHGGIGTPATRSSIIQTLFDRGYIVEHKKKIISTEKGQLLYDSLDDLVKYPDMTAKWHAMQEHIDGAEDVEIFVDRVMKDLIVPEIDRIKSTQLKMPVFDCPKCGRPMNRINGKNGHFWSCSGYKDKTCTHGMNDDNGKPVEREAKPAKLSEFNCKACGKPLVLRSGKSQKTEKPYSFFGCSGFPGCKERYNEKNGNPVFEDKEQSDE